VRTFEPVHESAWLRRVNDDAEFRHISRWTDLRFTLISDEDSRTYRVGPGQLAADGDGGRSAEIVLAGSAAAWSDFLAPVPPPHCNHVLAMDRRRTDFDVRSGRDELIRHLRVLDAVLQLMRPTGEEVTA
jgi:hypothetical protein